MVANPVIDAPFLGVPDVGGVLFLGMAALAFVGTFIGVTTGTAGGLLVLAVMALFFPPAILVPLHTFVQLGASTSIAVILREFILRPTVLPFLAGSVVGAMLGGQIFVALPTAVLQGLIGVFILLLGFGATFLGMFVSATGTLIAPFVASAAPDRRNHAATLGALMLFSHLAKLAAFGFIGVAIGSFLPLMAAMIVAGAAGNWLGEIALMRTTEQRFRLIFQWVLTALALRLLWSAAAGAAWI